MPANAGIQNILKILDPGVRRDDGKNEFRTFYEFIKFVGFGKNKRIATSPAQSNGRAMLRSFSVSTRSSTVSGQPETIPIHRG